MGSENVLDIPGSLRTEEFQVDCIGPAFIKYLCRIHATEEDLVERSTENEKESAIVLEYDLDYLKSLDPKEWKSQDHYAVLGLKNIRYKATMSDIKSAYRQMVLNHHPDKRKAKGEAVNQDSDYFTCITMAWETLGDPVKRKSYDSVDPYFDDELPSQSASYSEEQFYKVFGEQFSRNSRWSEKRPVPLLGGPNDPRPVVEKFYAFWYNFESWREYSYEDEESKEKGQDREERKWIEKQNKVVRAKKKKEEMARIRTLVDTAYAADPRIRKFLQDDKEKKENQKKAKAEAARARHEEMERARKLEEEEKRKKKEAEEAALKAKQEALKAEREQAKRFLKKEKKILRDTCKSNNYYCSSPSEEANNMKSVELLCESLTAEELKEFNNSLKEGGRDVFLAKVVEIEKKLEQERINSVNISKNKQKSDGGESREKWNDAQVSLLIKAVNLFPAGTNQRWEVVANFINQHSNTQRNAKEVLIKAKELQNNGDINNLIKQAANQKAFETFEKQKKPTAQVDEVQTSQRFEDSPWTSDEQKLLEQALKTYPATTADRWDQIASCVPSRSKKDCMKRYKELVEMVKAKKMAVKNTS